jgi:hypothetical protein
MAPHCRTALMRLAASMNVNFSGYCRYAIGISACGADCCGPRAWPVTLARMGNGRVCRGGYFVSDQNQVQLIALNGGMREIAAGPSSRLSAPRGNVIMDGDSDPDARAPR